MPRRGWDSAGDGDLLQAEGRSGAAPQSAPGAGVRAAALLRAGVCGASTPARLPTLWMEASPVLWPEERRVQGREGLGWPEVAKTVVRSSACRGDQDRLPRPPGRLTVRFLFYALVASSDTGVTRCPPAQGDGRTLCLLAVSGREPVCGTIAP